MKTKNIFFFFITFLFASFSIEANTNPVVTNVSHSYNGVTGEITITYDVTDAEQTIVTISIYVSSDGGATWDYSATQVTGDVGSGIAIGTGKSITWAHDAEHGAPPSGSAFLIKIVANDKTAGGSPCSGFEKVYYEGGPNNDATGAYYNTIQIGSQCWFKENLNVGTLVYHYTTQSSNGLVEKYCYSDNSANCAIYGGLYQWGEATAYNSYGSQGLCPAGWHIPTQAELLTLEALVNGDGYEMIKVGVSSGTNLSGFTALLAGDRRYTDGAFEGLTSREDFWSSTQVTSTTAHRGSVSSTFNMFSVYASDVNYGYSIRCLKN